MINYKEFRDTLVSAASDVYSDDDSLDICINIIQDAIREYGAVAQACTVMTLQYVYDRPSILATIVKSMGYALIGSHGANVFTTPILLQHESVEVRDAAVGMIEGVDGRCSEDQLVIALGILKSHTDTEDYMNEYIKQVIEDLSE